MPNWQRGMMRALRIPNHPVTVESIQDFTPWYRRITFSASALVKELEVFPSLWLRLWVPDPELGENRLHQRGYTFVDVQKQEGTFALDFVLHQAQGPAGSWARQAQVGERREVALTPRQVALPHGTERVLLAGDVTALPAINSWIESAPVNVAVSVAIEDGHTGQGSLPRVTHPQLEWSWVEEDPQDRGRELAHHLRTIQAPGQNLYAWAAGEKSLVKTIRPVLCEHLGLDRSQHFSQFYWIEGKPFS